MLLATCCEDAVVPHVLPFVDENIKNPDWKYRDAAVMAFGGCCWNSFFSTTILPSSPLSLSSTTSFHHTASFPIHAGSILEGPREETLKPIVEQAMPTLIELLKDPSIAIRDTSAWTVGRICELIPEAVGWGMALRAGLDGVGWV